MVKKHTHTETQGHTEEPHFLIFHKIKLENFRKNLKIDTEQFPESSYYLECWDLKKSKFN